MFYYLLIIFAKIAMQLLVCAALGKLQSKADGANVMSSPAQG